MRPHWVLQPLLWLIACNNGMWCHCLFATAGTEFLCIGNNKVYKFMRKILIIAAAVFLANNSAQAQETHATRPTRAQYWSVGPVIGAGHSWTSNMGGKTMYNPSGYVGVGAVYAKNEHWGWGGQLTIGSQGYSVEYTGKSALVRPIYIRVPVRAYYFFGDFRNKIRPKVYLGPSVAVKVGEMENIDPMAGDNMMMSRTGSFRTMDIGVNAGAGVNIQLAKATWFNIDIGYYQGVIDVVKDAAEQNNMNQNLGLNLGILLGVN